MTKPQTVKTIGLTSIEEAAFLEYHGLDSQILVGSDASVAYLYLDDEDTKKFLELLKECGPSSNEIGYLDCLIYLAERTKEALGPDEEYLAANPKQ